MPSFQKSFGVSTAALLIAASVMQAHDIPRASSVAIMALLANNMTKLNRSLRRDMPLRFGVVGLEMLYLTMFGLVQDNKDPLRWRAVTSVLGFLCGEPAHLKAIQNKETAQYYCKKDTEAIAYGPALRELLSLPSLQKNLEESLSILTTFPKTRDDRLSYAYAVALATVTVGAAMQNIFPDSPLCKLSTMTGIITANAIGMHRYWSNENNVTGCIGNLLSTLGYSLLDTDAGLSLLTLSMACQSLSQCGIKGSGPFATKEH